MLSTVQPHNERVANVWNSGGSDYDNISRGIADSIAHCVLRLDPKPGERILDLATGTGWTSRAVAQSGATVTGADISSELLAAATSGRRPTAWIFATTRPTRRACPIPTGLSTP